MKNQVKTRGGQPGEKNSRAKITNETAVEIALALLRKHPAKEIAESFGCSLSCVREIRAGKAWVGAISDRLGQSWPPKWPRDTWEESYKKDRIRRVIDEAVEARMPVRCIWHERLLHSEFHGTEKCCLPLEVSNRIRKQAKWHAWQYNKSTQAFNKAFTEFYTKETDKWIQENHKIRRAQLLRLEILARFCRRNRETSRRADWTPQTESLAS